MCQGLFTMCQGLFTTVYKYIFIYIYYIKGCYDTCYVKKRVHFEDRTSSTHVRVEMTLNRWGGVALGT